MRVGQKTGRALTSLQALSLDCHRQHTSIFPASALNPLFLIPFGHKQRPRNYCRSTFPLCQHQKQRAPASAPERGCGASPGWAFIQTTPATLTALDEALTLADREALGATAPHRKSPLDGLAVASLRPVIREHEAYGDTPPTAAARQVAQMRATTEEVMAGLRQEFPEQP